MELERIDDAGELTAALRRSGYALLTPFASRSLSGIDTEGWRRLRESWATLPRDTYMKDGGHYRARRHASLVQELGAGTLRSAPPRAHWQPTDYNALHGGMTRWFEPIEAEFLALPGIQHAIATLGEQLARLRPEPRWFIEVHQVRIDTTGGIGRPTPEGAHRDGVDFVAIWFAGRDGIRGGETRVFDATGAAGVRFTLEEPGTVLVLDDARVIHETTPIQPARERGVRDTLIVTYRARGFLEPLGG